MGSYSLITQTLTILLWEPATCQKCQYAQKSAVTLKAVYRPTSNTESKYIEVPKFEVSTIFFIFEVFILSKAAFTYISKISNIVK